MAHSFFVFTPAIIIASLLLAVAIPGLLVLIVLRLLGGLRAVEHDAV